MKRRAHLVDVWKATWIDHFFDLPLWARGLLVGFMAGLLGLILDVAAHAFGYPWFYERVFENAVEGLFIAVVVFWLSLLREKRRQRRMREIGYLNHHIRNAMQAIELAVQNAADAQERMVIDLSVRHVIETLSRISRGNDESNLDSRLDLRYAP
jgi:hypothetical protein